MMSMQEEVVEKEKPGLKNLLLRCTTEYYKV